MTSASEEQHTKNQDDASMPFLVLEVINGKTEQKLRPVLNHRFLIGSASTCHLQIGDETFPPLHSIILIGPDHAEIDTVASSPLLILNGENRDCATLHQGDQIEIGGVQLRVHLQESQKEQMDDQQEQAHIVPFPDSENLLEEENENSLSDLSAEELVDLIEAEEQMIEEYEANLQTGLSALLHEAGVSEEQVSSHARENASKEENQKWAEIRVQLAKITGQPVEEHSGTFESELEQIIAHLSSVAEELETRSKEIDEREKEYSEASESLLESQQQLSDQLDYLLAKAEEMNLKNEAGQIRRAS